MLAAAGALACLTAAPAFAQGETFPSGFGFYGGGQYQGGIDVGNELSSATSQEIEVEESFTWIVGVRARF